MLDEEEFELVCPQVLLDLWVAKYGDNRDVHYVAANDWFWSHATMRLVATGWMNRWGSFVHGWNCKLREGAPCSGNATRK